jgi:fatty acid desaturase
VSHTTSGAYRLSGGSSGAIELREGQFEERVEHEWYSPVVDRKQLKNLMQRSDVEGWKHFGPWLVLLLGSGVGAFLTFGTWWCVPFFAVYGAMYSMSDHHAHELWHGTPFRTRWINEVFHHLNGFMTLHEGYAWRWSHTRHHTETLFVGRDPEIAAPRPPDIAGLLSDLFYIKSAYTQLKKIAGNAFRRFDKDTLDFVPETELGKVALSSRVYIGIILATVGSCLVWQTILPALFVVTPRMYGGPLAQIFNITQHAGLAENVRDHRLNTRTVILNPVFAWMYMNMNYHIEHHMFPMVPFYNLPKLHALIKNRCPEPYRGLVEAYREIIPALMRQVRDPTWFVTRELPVTVAASPRSVS